MKPNVSEVFELLSKALMAKYKPNEVHMADVAVAAFMIGIVSCSTALGVQMDHQQALDLAGQVTLDVSAFIAGVQPPDDHTKYN